MPSKKVSMLKMLVGEKLPNVQVVAKYHNPILPVRFGANASKGSRRSLLGSKECFIIQFFLGRWRSSVFVGM